MCPPTYFFSEKGYIDYQINHWMKKGTPVDNCRAMWQWDTLKTFYENAGCPVILIEPQPGLPDFVFTANYGLVLKHTIVLSRFRHQERHSEEFFIRNWFKKNHYSLIELPKPLIFEGQGDVLRMGNTIFLGYGYPQKEFRTDRKAHDYINVFLKRYGGGTYQAVSLQLVDPRFYHLDTCFCPLDEDLILYFPDAFDSASINRIRAFVKNPISVSEKDAERFICNSVPLGNQLVMGAHPTNQLRTVLEKLDWQIVVVELDEFFKSGGSARCLTLNL